MSEKILWGLLCALMVAIYNQWAHQQAARKARQALFLREQLQHLYAPLALMVGQNEACLNLNEHLVCEYGFPALTQGEHKSVDDVALTYCNYLDTNQQKMMEILRENFSFVDVDDMELFSQFAVDQMRYTTERRIPHTVKNALPSLWRNDEQFIGRVREKFTQKQHLLRRLGG